VSQTKAQLLEGKTDQDVNAKTIALAGATSGTATISATAIAGTPTLTLPSASGTIDLLNRAGNILQVVNATYSTSTSNNTSTFADTGLTATITPTSSSSKILVLVDQSGCGKNNSNTYLSLRLLRGSTTISTFANGTGYTATTAANYFGSCSLCYLDSPSTTSAIIYKTQLASIANTSVALVQSDNEMSTITLMEIAA
jgi:hypothetical protein